MYPKRTHNELLCTFLQPAHLICRKKRNFWSGFRTTFFWFRKVARGRNGSRGHRNEKKGRPIFESTKIASKSVTINNREGRYKVVTGGSMERKLHRAVLVVHGRRKTIERDKKKRFKCACLSLHSFDFKHKANFEKKEKHKRGHDTGG